MPKYEFFLKQFTAIPLTSVDSLAAKQENPQTTVSPAEAAAAAAALHTTV